MAYEEMTGAKILVQALIDQGITDVFGYPGGAILPVYDELFQQNQIRHVLVRQEGEPSMAPRVMRARPARSASSL